MFFNGHQQTCYFLIYSILSLSKINVDARYFFINEWNTVDHRTPADIMVDVTNNIGLLVLECHNIQNRNNIAFSPYGLTSVLIALYEGVAGEAAIQIHRTARFPYEKDVIRVGFRDIHRLLRSYFLPKEGFLAGLSLNNENITLTPEYKAILQFYGYDLNPNFTATQTPNILTGSSSTPSTPIVSSTAELSTAEMTSTNSMTESSTIIQSKETSESTVAQTELETTTSMTNKEQTTNELSTTSEPDVTTESTIINTPTTEVTSLTSQITTNIPDESNQTQSSTTESSESQTTISTQMSITSTSEKSPTSEPSEQSTNENISPETLESDGVIDKTESASIETTLDSTSNEIETFSEENQLVSDASSTMAEATSTENMTVSPATDSITASETTTNVDVTTNSETTTNVDVTTNSETTTNVDITTVNSETTTNVDVTTTNSETTTNVDVTTTNSETTTNVDVTTDSETTINVDEETTSMNSNTVTSTTQIDTTTMNSESEVTRRKRSLADFIIARYYDGPFAFREPQSPANTNVSLRQKHQYPFLVNGIHAQYNVNYTEYDAVLPFNYLEQIEAVALRLPLDSDKYYLLIVLPLNPQGINNLICDIRKYENVRNIVRGLKETYVRAVIPSFMLKGFVILTNTLQRLGIRNVFEPGHANFSPMTFEHDLYVTNIEQAVTVTIRNYREPTITKKRHYNYPPIEFKVTHPFMYFIIDSTLDVALMAGKIVNPLNLRIQ